MEAWSVNKLIYIAQLKGLLENFQVTVCVHTKITSPELIKSVSITCVCVCLCVCVCVFIQAYQVLAVIKSYIMQSHSRMVHL